MQSQEASKKSSSVAQSARLDATLGSRGRVTAPRGDYRCSPPSEDDQPITVEPVFREAEEPSSQSYRTPRAGLAGIVTAAAARQLRTEVASVLRQSHQGCRLPPRFDHDLALPEST